MTVRGYKKDPRARAQQRADEEILAAFEHGKRLALRPEAERAAARRVERAYRERADAARLGLELGLLRKVYGLSQEAVARAVSTQKSNISRIESGRYGGLTIERFFAIVRAIRSIAGEPDAPIPSAASAPLVREQTLETLKTPGACIEG